MIINSNTLTFIDTTDTKKIDIHISSNHPTVQIYDGKTYTPDWQTKGLVLTATAHADSTPITNFSTYKWVKIIGSEITEYSLSSTTNTLVISENIPTDVPMIRYKCYVTYNKKTYSNEITFTRINDGFTAPTVQAHYSIDGKKVNMEATLDPTIHKYIHFSYDGGKNWTEGIKITGERGEAGQSISLKGAAYTNSELVAGNTVILYSDEAKQILISSGDSGDSYLVGGYLCVYNGEKFICTGQIQGPKGEDGTSYYLYIRYADNTSGANFSDVPGKRKYIGFYRSTVTPLPTSIDKGSATWNWAKFVGEDIKSIVLTGNTQVFKADKNNDVSPSTIKVTAQTQNTTVTSWSYNTDGSTIFSDVPPAGVSLLGDIVTIIGSEMTSDLITIKASDGVHSDIFTVYKVSDGADGDVGADGKPAPIVFLTNENITFSANEDGQVPGTTVYCNVVAYSGTTQVTPTIGIISSARLPSGMSINPDDIVTVVDQIQIPITIEDGATLGSTQNTNGEIHIPIISPIETTLQLNWSKINSGKKGDKGDKGSSIKSTTVTYGVSDSASVQPSDDLWQTTIPVVADGKYLWTRTVIDYTDDDMADTVTYTYAKQGTKGNTGSNGSSVSVSSIQYKEGTSAIIAPTGTWSNSVVDVAEGKYLWTKTVFSDGKIAYGIAKQGVSGKNGADAYTVMLTNESHIFAGDIANAVASSATTQILAYKGTTIQPVTIVSVNGKTATTTDTDTGIAGLKFKCSALNGASPTITFTCTTSFVSPSGTIPIVLSVDGVSIIKMFTYSIAFKGATGGIGNTGPAGSPATAYWLVSSASAVQKTSNGTTVATIPSVLTFTGKSQTGVNVPIDYACRWVVDVSTNGTSYTNLSTSAANETSKSITVLPTYKSIRVKMYMAGGTTYLLDEQIIPVISDGMVDLEIGGRNLILSSNIPVSSILYPIYTYQMSEDWILGATYTVTIKGTINSGQAFGIWANGSASRVATLTYDEAKGVHRATFTPTAITTQKPKTLHLYNTPSATATEASIEWIKLEKGNKPTTDWYPAPEDLTSITFQLYAPKGYLITNDVPEVTLQTFAYDGSQAITNATFAWYSWNGEVWSAISGATNVSLTLNKTNVLRSKVYKCIMTYKEKTYEATATVEDKTDIYDSLINVSAKYSPTNRIYWVLYSTVYSEEGERDKLLGPISVTAPVNPTTGSYWYKIDEVNYTVTLMKYSGTAWAATTDKQEFVYDWFLFNDTTNIVSLGAQSKVKIVTSSDFVKVCSVQCNVSDSTLVPMTHNNQILSDPSDPIVSTVEPTNPINGQLWIKTGANGVYTLLVWDASLGQWIVSEADSQVKVHINKPTSYEIGDVWVVSSDYEPTIYINGVAQTTKHLAGTMLKAQYSSQTYKDSDWVEALNYNKEIDELKENLNVYNQFFTFDDTGMTMRAKNLSGKISEFSTKLTNNELGFYQGENKVAYINNNQLNISKAEISNGMTIGGAAPVLEIGNFAIIQESNGSLSIGLKS